MRTIVRFGGTLMCCVMIVIFSRSASAQVSSEPLEFGLQFGAGPTYSRLAGGSNFYFHTFTRNLIYTDLGSGYGFVATAGLHIPFTSRFGVLVQFEIQQLNSSRTEEYGGLYTRSYAKEWDYTGGSILFRAAYVPNAYVLFGAGYYWLVNDNFSASEYLTSDPQNPTVNFKNLQSHGYYNPLKLDLKIGLGFAFALFDNLVLRPEIIASIPLTDLYTPGANEDYALNGSTPPNLYYLTAGLKIDLPFSPGSAAPTPVEPEPPAVQRIPATLTGPAPRVRPAIPPLMHSLLAAPLVLHFAFDSARIERLIPSDSERIRIVATELKATRGKKLIIEGHTDSVGSEAYNLRLSHERTEEVEKYLMTLGVPASQLAVIAYGSAKPLRTNETEVGRAENRRVVLRLSE